MITAAIVAAANLSLVAAARAALLGWYRLDNSVEVAAVAFCNAVAFGDIAAPEGVDCTDAAALADALRNADDEALFYTLLGAARG